MKKKSLILALLCSAVVCGAVGGTLNVLPNVKAEQSTPTLEWTDEETGTTYQFDHDIVSGYYVDADDMWGDSRLSSADGVTIPSGELSGQNPGQFSYEKDVIISDGNGYNGGTNGVAFATSGVQFDFKTDVYWGGGDNSTETDWRSGWIRILYGNTYIQLRHWGDQKTYLHYDVFHVGNNQTGGYIWLNGDKIENFFTLNETNPDGWDYVMRDFSTMKISRIKCTNALGYWLKISLTIADGTEAILYDAFVPYTMQQANVWFTDARWDGTDAAGGYVWNLVGISNATGGWNIKNGTATSGVKPNLTVRRVGGTSNEIEGKDVADLTSTDGSQKTFSDKLVSGGLLAPSQSGEWGTMWAQPTNGLYFNNAALSAGNINFAFRFSFDGQTPSSASQERLFRLSVGSSSFMAFYEPGRQQLIFENFNWKSGKTLGLLTAYQGVPGYTEDGKVSARENFDFSAIYAVRVTRSVLADEKGSVNKLYMAKVNPATGMPGEGWDSVPVCAYIDPYTVDWDGRVEFAPLYPKLTCRVSSNQYTSVTLDGAVNRLPIGNNSFTVRKTDSTAIHCGFSENGSKELYEEKTYTNILAPVNVKSVKLTAAVESVQLRWFERAVTKEVYDFGIKWNFSVNAQDYSSLRETYGAENVKLYYKLTLRTAADKDAAGNEVSGTTEGYVVNYENAEGGNYNFSIVQMRIAPKAYNGYLWAQVGLEIDGEKVGLTSEYKVGHSVDSMADYYTATRTEGDVQLTNGLAPTADAVVGWTNAVKDQDGNVGYSALTQQQYDYLCTIGAYYDADGNYSGPEDPVTA